MQRCVHFGMTYVDISQIWIVRKTKLPDCRCYFYKWTGSQGGYYIRKAYQLVSNVIVSRWATQIMADKHSLSGAAVPKGCKAGNLDKSMSLQMNEFTIKPSTTK
uniref:Uncharacterized protein n=1 Tax=Glossina pallidipes TaxID=7398 RepID=A0A1B0A668_GLOPL